MVYNQLLEYVGNVVLLENAIAQQKDVLQKINARCEDLGKLGKPMNINTSLHIFSNISGCLFLSIIVEVIGLVVGALINAHEVCLIITSSLCLLFFIGILDGFRTDKKKIDLAMKTDAERCQRDQKLLDDLCRVAASIANNISHLQAKLDGLYAQNVIFPDFRGNVPTSYLYKYLAARICTQLEGPDGAYAQYLQDERTNRIINRLDRIVSMLTCITSNQRVQIGLLNQINHTLTDINQNIGCLNQSLASIQQELSQLVNTQIDANTYLSKISGQLNSLSADINATALYSQAAALNQYSAAIESGVAAYQLAYPA